MEKKKNTQNRDVSILMSLYIKESPNYFDLSLESIYNQTLKPKEIILVLDGPITSELKWVLNKWLNILPITLVPLKKNHGLAYALNEGLKHCKSEFIARMDTDDICTIDRLSCQSLFLNDNPRIDVVGTWISEINENNDELRHCIKYPLAHSELFNFFKKRDPIAHPTAMFRKSFFEKAGTYPTDLFLAEDTAIWFSGFKNNCQFANIPYVGLKFRRTSNFYLRRADRKKTILLLRYRIFKINRELSYGLVSDIYAILYALLALSPIFIKKIMYKYLR